MQFLIQSPISLWLTNFSKLGPYVIFVYVDSPNRPYFSCDGHIPWYHDNLPVLMILPTSTNSNFCVTISGGYIHVSHVSMTWQCLYSGPCYYMVLHNTSWSNIWYYNITWFLHRFLLGWHQIVHSSRLDETISARCLVIACVMKAGTSRRTLHANHCHCLSDGVNCNIITFN